MIFLRRISKKYENKNLFLLIKVYKLSTWIWICFKGKFLFSFCWIGSMIFLIHELRCMLKNVFFRFLRDKDTYV